VGKILFSEGTDETSGEARPKTTAATMATFAITLSILIYATLINISDRQRSMFHRHQLSP